MFSMDGSLSWIWWIVGGIVLFSVMGMAKGGIGGAKYYHVPDGESWRTVYRQKVINPEKKAASPVSKLVFGLGFGLMVVAVLIVVYDPF